MPLVRCVKKTNLILSDEVGKEEIGVQNFGEDEEVRGFGVVEKV
jgi:hypothetical protein